LIPEPPQIATKGQKWMSDTKIRDNIPIQPIASDPHLLPIRQILPVQAATVRKPLGPVVQRKGIRPGIHVRATATPISTVPVEIVKKDVTRVQKAWKQYQSTNSRDAVYIYLTAVYNVVTRWKRQDLAEEYSRLALDLQLDPIDMDPEPFAILIFCTSDRAKVNTKTRSNWSRVLRVVEAGKKRDETLKEFVKWQGGINRCAALF
jgi:hypothetical protein